MGRWTDREGAGLTDRYMDRQTYALDRQDRIYLLGKTGYVFAGVGLFVCLSVSNITQILTNVLQ